MDNFKILLSEMGALRDGCVTRWVRYWLKRIWVVANVRKWQTEDGHWWYDQ